MASLPGPSNAVQSHLLTSLASPSSARLESLYSDFSPSQTLNPSGFASNVSFWSSFLRSLLSHGLQRSTGKIKGKGKAPGDQGADVLVLHADDALLDSLRLPGLGAPYGLPVSLESILASRARPPSLIGRRAFLASPKSIYDPRGWAEWIWAGVAGGVGWGLGALGVSRGEDEGEEAAESRWKTVKGEWVHVGHVEEAAGALWDLVAERAALSSADRLHTRATLRAEILDSADLLGTGAKLTSDADLDILLKYLQRDRRRLIAEGEIIKFAPPSGTAQDEAMEITETDRGIVEVRETARQLELQIASLEAQITSRTEKAREYLSASPPNKSLATTHLRIRASLVSLLTKRSDSLLTLRRVLDSINQASSDAELSRVYAVSSRTLKSLVEKTGGVEKVERVREGLEEAIADQKEVEEAMDGVVGAGPAIDEDEVQGELKELIAAEEEAKRQKEGDRTQERDQELEDKLKALKPPTQADSTPVAGDLPAEAPARAQEAT